MWMLHCLSKAQGWWGGGGWCLEQQTFSLPLLYRRGAQHCSDGFIKHCLEASLRKCWAFEIFHCTWGKQRHSHRAALQAPAALLPAASTTQARHCTELRYRVSHKQPTTTPLLPYRSLWPWQGPVGRWWESASSPSASQSCPCHPADRVWCPREWWGCWDSGAAPQDTTAKDK